MLYLVLQDGSPIFRRAPAGGGAGAETEDDEKGATPQYKVRPRGRTASDADGAAVDYS